METRGYQYGFSEGNTAMHAEQGRTRKALTMLAVLKDALGKERLSRSRILNVGCSTGIIDEAIAPHVKSVTGIDIDEAAIHFAIRNNAQANVTFEFGDAMSLRFEDNSFDVIICSQVYEHVPDANKLMDEIERVLLPGGVCYFGATNRFCVMEKHYHLPFLSVIPVPIAHLYLRALRRGSYYHERHLTYGGLRRLASRFNIRDMTLDIVRDPDRFGVGYMLSSKVSRQGALLLGRFAYWAFPGYVWLLEKRRKAP